MISQISFWWVSESGSLACCIKMCVLWENSLIITFYLVISIVIASTYLWNVMVLAVMASEDLIFTNKCTAVWRHVSPIPPRAICQPSSITEIVGVSSLPIYLIDKTLLCKTAAPEILNANDAGLAECVWVPTWAIGVTANEKIWWAWVLHGGCVTLR